MGLWVALVVFYGLAKGAREGIKKIALQKNGVIEVLFLHTALSFLMTIPFSHGVFQMPPIYHLWIVIKSFCIFLAWICAFNSIKKMPISLYGVIDSTRMLFSVTLALMFLNETMTLQKGIGMAFVLAGVIAVNIGNKSDERVKFGYLAMALFSCALNAVSGFMDKKLLSGGELNSSQLQFWYMLYMTVFYGLYVLFTKCEIKLSSLKTNPWIIVLSVLFVAADRALFIANEDPQSQVTIMTLIKQSSVLITVLTGKLFFKEKHILKRSICAALVITGILIATLI